MILLKHSSTSGSHLSSSQAFSRGARNRHNSPAATVRLFVGAIPSTLDSSDVAEAVSTAAKARLPLLAVSIADCQVLQGRGFGFMDVRADVPDGMHENARSQLVAALTKTRVACHDSVVRTCNSIPPCASRFSPPPPTCRAGGASSERAQGAGQREQQTQQSRRA